MFKTEVWDKVNGWQWDDVQASPHMYHSTAGYRPSGRIVSAGGDIRQLDWEIYEPRARANGQTIPLFVGSFGSPGFQNLVWDTEYIIEHAPLPVGISISRVVFMRPGASTHAFDMDQRYVELRNVTTDDEVLVNAVKVKTPKLPVFSGNVRGSVETLSGWHMAFLVTSQGTPSQARWVKL